MFAVIKTGGKQYRVAKDDVLKVERLSAEAGQSVAIDQVLMVGEDGQAPQVGAPLVKDASVTAEVLEQARGPKIRVFKKKRRKGYRRTHGHRQDQTVLRITEIKVGGASSDKSAETAQKKAAAKKDTSGKAAGAKEAGAQDSEAKGKAKAKAAEDTAGASKDSEAKTAQKKSADASGKKQGKATSASAAKKAESESKGESKNKGAGAGGAKASETSSEDNTSSE